MIAKKKILINIVILLIILGLGIATFYIVGYYYSKPKYSTVSLTTFDNKVSLILGEHLGVSYTDGHYNYTNALKSDTLLQAINDCGEIVATIEPSDSDSSEYWLLLYEGYYFTVKITDKVVTISSLRFEVRDNIPLQTYIPYVDAYSIDDVGIDGYNPDTVANIIYWDQNKFHKDFDSLANAYKKSNLAYNVRVDYDLKKITLSSYVKGQGIIKFYAVVLSCDDEGIRFYWDREVKE
ncbi:MAG: hypothetical protein LBE09_08845 [Christensenellaceae bacterium]|jgi:hypothetical protein|nr:hypothetical protein [Christensenellaceae bacterium]